MGGITGTAIMFAESAGKKIVIDIEKIERPKGVPEFDWLTSVSYTHLRAHET